MRGFIKPGLCKYRHGKIPLSAVVSVIHAWMIRFDTTYLKEQTFFEPYPEELVQVTDSGKGREFEA